jgi:hypothetical protein
MAPDVPGYLNILATVGVESTNGDDNRLTTIGFAACADLHNGFTALQEVNATDTLNPVELPRSLRLTHASETSRHQD